MRRRAPFATLRLIDIDLARTATAVPVPCRRSRIRKGDPMTGPMPE